MSLPLELNCIVFGDDSRRIFPIEINGTKKVGDLKELMKDKKKPLFDHIPADALDLFNVNFLVDGGLDDKLKQFRPEDEIDRLLSNTVKRLKGVFGDPIDDHLHVIVVPPTAGE